MMNTYNKILIRKKITAQRDNIPAELSKKNSEQIVNFVIANHFFEDSEYITCYYPFRNEVNLLSLLNKAPSKKYLFPKVVKGTRKLEFYHVETLNQFSSGTFGVMEPLSTLDKVEIENIDLFLIPGVAFSCSGERIGYGGGYYDTTLSFRNKKSRSYGICFDAQLIESGFSDSWDIKMDATISESGLKFISN